MTRFLLDSHLGKLARWLRMLGHDTELKQDPKDPLGSFVWQAKINGRIPVTVRKHVPKDLRSDVVIISHGSVIEQLQELTNRGYISIPMEINLADSRCSLCNGVLRELSMDDPNDLAILQSHPDLKPGTLRFQRRFYLCKNLACRKLYWEGAHWEKIKKSLRKIHP